MALSSQMSRQDRPMGGWGSASKRRTRSPVARLAALASVAAMLAIGGWVVWGLTSGDDAEAAEPLASGEVPGGAVLGDTLAAAPGLSTPLPAAPLPAAPTPPPASEPAAFTPPREDPRPSSPPPVVLDMGRSEQPRQSDPPPQRALAEQPQPQTAPTASNPVTTPPAASPPARPAPTVSDRLPSDVAAWVAAAERARAENKLVEARTLLNRALLDTRTTEADRAALRRNIADLNETLIFSPTVVRGDPLTDTYSVQSGDSLARITSRLGLGVDWRLVQRVNRISNPSRIHVGQKLKVVRGPFHAVVDKSDFRMDIYAGEPISASAAGKPARADGVEPGWVYIRSFRVGLGEAGSTPLGTFIVRPRSKLINPFWRNPRTGEEFAADDPKNPIGEHWLGLEGLDDATRQYQGYGVHGTIEPDSIGKEMSMGCVRLVAEDIALVYELLEEGISIVRIVP